MPCCPSPRDDRGYLMPHCLGSSQAPLRKQDGHLVRSAAYVSERSLQYAVPKAPPHQHTRRYECAVHDTACDPALHLVSPSEVGDQVEEEVACVYECEAPGLSLGVGQDVEDGDAVRTHAHATMVITASQLSTWRARNFHPRSSCRARTRSAYPMLR